MDRECTDEPPRIGDFERPLFDFLDGDLKDSGILLRVEDAVAPLYNFTRANRLSIERLSSFTSSSASLVRS